MNITEWTLTHLEKTASGNYFDADAALDSAKQSTEWADYAALLEHRGWAAYVADAKRRWKSARFNHAVDRLWGQQAFPFLDHVYSVGNRLKKTESLTMEEFQEVIAIRERSRDADSEVIKGLKNFFRRLLPLWSDNPGLSLLEIVDLL